MMTLNIFSLREKAETLPKEGTTGRQIITVFLELWEANLTVSQKSDIYI